MIRLALAVLIVGLAGCVPHSVAADSPDLRHLHGLGDVRYLHVESETLSRGFHVFVRLPEGYSDRTATKLPTVYLLDGGITFPLLASYSRYLSLAEESPDSILVGISYGTNDWRKGNLRGTDFTAKSSEREHWGGAPHFQEMLRRELFPLIESRYPSDPARRIVFGQSLGGQFVLYTALTDPTLFWGHIASNPALHRNLPFFLESRQWPPESSGTSKVFVASAEHDEPRFREPAKRWMEHWAQVEAKPWQLETMTLEGHNHFSAATAAFRKGMLWLFER